MRFNNQLHPHRPQDGFVGDCFRTCISCLLGLPVTDVPNWYQIEFDTIGQPTEFESPEVKKMIDDWMNGQGYHLLRMPMSGDHDLSQLTLQVESINGRVLYMVQGSSDVGEHVVIYKGADLLWDPGFSKKGIVAPGAGNIYWFIFLISETMVWNGCLPPV